MNSSDILPLAIFGCIYGIPVAMVAAWRLVECAKEIALKAMDLRIADLNARKELQ